MSRAVKCDGCGNLVAVEAVRLDVSAPKGRFEGEVAYETWSDVEFCRECLARPLGEMLSKGCAGIKLAGYARPRRAAGARP